MTTTPTTPAERAAHARHGYSSLQIAFHWSVAVLVVVQWLVGQGMEEVFEGRQAGEDLAQYGPAFVHIVLGVVILGTMIARLMARLRRPVETAAGTRHPVMALWGRINHWAFYAVLLAMPPLGALAWFAGSEAAGTLHGLLSWLLVALILLHLAGAAVHGLLGENIVRRIVRPTPGT